jgi:DNA-binding NarL/FixJ family response regulator
LHCEGLAKLLGADGGFEVRTTTSSDESGIRDAFQGNVDVVLVDLAAPESHEVIGALAECAPGAPIVALSVPPDEGAVIECVKAGVTAFLSREATVGDLRRTVVLAARGESPGPAWLMPMLLRRVAADAGHYGSAAAASLDRLTHREQEVLELLGRAVEQADRARALHRVADREEPCAQHLREARGQPAHGGERAAACGGHARTDVTGRGGTSTCSGPKIVPGNHSFAASCR